MFVFVERTNFQKDFYKTLLVVFFLQYKRFLNERFTERLFSKKTNETEKMNDTVENKRNQFVFERLKKKTKKRVIQRRCTNEMKKNEPANL